jgi:hypothetical protein
MEKRTAGLLGAIAGLATMGAAHASIPPAPNAADMMQASSYADLLTPIPNAAALIKADDAARSQQPKPEGTLQLVDYPGYGVSTPRFRDHHHHHHHHQAYNRHHHHHHHHGTEIGIPGIGVVVGRH